MRRPLSAVCATLILAAVAVSAAGCHEGDRAPAGSSTTPTSDQNPAPAAGAGNSHTLGTSGQDPASGK